MPDVTFNAAALVAAHQRAQQEAEAEAVKAAQPAQLAQPAGPPAQAPTYITVRR